MENQVRTMIEKKNIERLKKECYKTVNGNPVIKTKTASIYKYISNQNYKREPRAEVLQLSKQETKTLVIARYGMLECGMNYKGTLKTTCNQCKCEDDENHRLNYCSRYRENNLYGVDEKVNFNIIHATDANILKINLG